MISKMSIGGYDYEIVGNTFDDFFCKTCEKLMKDAVQLECGHGMCNECLQRLSIQSEEEHIDLKCPNCEKIISKDKAFPATMINQIILCVKVKCKNSQQGCDWAGSIGEISDHLKQMCNYEETKCNNENCEISLPRPELIKHEESCEFRPVNCEHCQITYQFKDDQEHQENCEMIPVSCPNKCIDIIIPRMKLQDHIKNCTNKLVQCTFSFIGCKEALQQINLDDHKSASVHHHMELLMKDYIKTQSMVKIIQEDNKDLRKQLAGLSEDQETTEVDVIALKKDLLHAQATVEELKLLEEKKTKHAFVWVEKKVVESFNAYIGNLVHEIDISVQKCKSDVKTQVIEFDKRPSIIQQKLPMLISGVDKIIEQAIKEVESVCIPLENLEKVLSSTLLEIEKEVPFEEEFWTDFGADRWEKLLLLISVGSIQKVNVNEVKKDLHNLREMYLTYGKRFKGMMNCRADKKWYKEGNFLCVVAYLNEITKYELCDIIAKQSGEYLKVGGVLNDTPELSMFSAVRLHNQLCCEDIEATLDKQGCRFNVYFEKLVEKSFIVDELVVLSLYLSSANSGKNQTTPTVMQNNASSNHTKSMADIVKASLPSVSSVKPPKKHRNEIDVFKSELIEHIKASTGYAEIQKKLNDKVANIKDEIRTNVNTFDDSMLILSGNYGNFKDYIDEKIRYTIENLEEIVEPASFCDIESELDSKIKSFTVQNLESLLKQKAELCQFISRQLNELHYCIRGLTGLRSIMHFPDRFYGLLAKKLFSDNQVYWNHEQSIVVLKCTIKESQNVYKKFSVNITNNILSVEGVNSVEINQKKPVAVIIHNHFENKVLRATKSPAAYVFSSVNFKELKKQGYIKKDIAVFTILTDH